MGVSEGRRPLAVEGSRYTVTAEVSLKLGDFSQTDPTKILTYKNIRLNATRCANVLDKFPYFKKSDAFDDSLVRSAHCFFPPDDLKDQYWIKGQPLDSYFSSFDIKIWPCSLDDRSQCDSSRSVEGHTMLLVYPTPDLDYSKIDNFLDWIGFADTNFDITPSVIQKYSFTFKHFEVFDQQDVFSNPKKRREFFAVQNSLGVNTERNERELYCPKGQIGGPHSTCSPYLHLSFSSSNRVETVTRTYTSLIKALAEIGGFVELVFLFVGLIYFIFNCYFKELKTQLVRKVFGIRRAGKKMREYSEVIDQNLDMVEVMKELNGLKVINRAVFKDHHLELMPELLTEMKKKEGQETKKSCEPELAKSDQDDFFSGESKFLN